MRIGLIAEMIKLECEELHHYILSFFNAILEKREIPK